MHICKYCEKNEAIENSHIIPSFICSWVKETSPTKVLRRTDNPNHRQQDGLKEPLLCNDCEVKFSTYEGELKKKIFNKIANYRVECPDELEFTEGAFNCITSIAWRVLASAYYFPVDNQYTGAEFEEFPNFLNKTKEMIETGSEHYEIQFIPCFKETIEQIGLPKVDFTYYDRGFSAEPRIWGNWARFNIFIKIPFGIFIFELVKNRNDNWLGTKVTNKQKFTVSDVDSVPDVLGLEVEHFYNSFLKGISEISEKQKSIIEKDIESFEGDCGSFKTMRKTWD